MLPVRLGLCLQEMNWIHHWIGFINTCDRHLLSISLTLHPDVSGATLS